VNQQPGETRLALLQRNAEIFAGIIPPIVRAARDAIILIATNPLDIMTQIATKLAVREGMPASRVLGTGTMLDTGRFRTLLGQRYNVAPSSVHAYVLGEHGDSEVLNWSGASVAGVPLEQFALASGQPLTQKSCSRWIRMCGVPPIKSSLAKALPITASVRRLRHSAAVSCLMNAVCSRRVL
jgi:L-lactate dehydrogenase